MISSQDRVLSIVLVIACFGNTPGRNGGKESRGSEYEHARQEKADIFWLERGVSAGTSVRNCTIELRSVQEQSSSSKIKTSY